MASNDIQIHIITASTATPTNLQPLLNLSNSVFTPVLSPEQMKPSHLLSGWQEYISHPHAAIFYATSPDHPNEPLGFFFATPRTQPEVGHELLHLFIAAIKPSSRGLGIFPRLMARLEEHARANGYREMTANTFPDRFETMWRILRKHGWEVAGWRGEKVVMKIGL